MSDNGRKDLHAILGVSEQAGAEELRRAYLALAVKYHPDRNPGDPEAEERFKDISQAYAVLSDPAARARYERLMKARRGGAAGGAGPRPEAKPSGASAGPSGTAGQTGPSARPESQARADKAGPDNGSAGPGAAGSSSQGTANSSETDFEDVLNGFFKSAKGRDLLKDLENELKKAGVKFNLEDFTRWVKNRKAATDTAERRPLWNRLTGWLTGADARARKEVARFEVRYQLALTPEAAASGTTVEITYPREAGEHRLKIRIPAGAKDGSRMRLSGQGRLKPDGSRGDLVLTVQVGPRQSVADLWK